MNYKLSPGEREELSTLVRDLKECPRAYLSKVLHLYIKGAYKNPKDIRGAIACWDELVLRRAWDKVMRGTS